MEYTIMIEKAAENSAAHVPDLPGCVATGVPRDEAIQEIETAIALHIERLREHGEAIPTPQCSAAVVEVAP